MINIKTDSRKILPGDIFVALKGINSNGDDYIESAIEKGAQKIICETGNYSVETINVENPRAYLLEYLKDHYNQYLEKMKIIGITGTNGKTTSAYLLSELFNHLGKKSAYIGTIGFYIGTQRKCLLNNTTPDVCDLYDLFIQAYDEGCECIILEVSSQGLDVGRLDSILFDVAIFTNLTQDHLDYHKTMENYALAKQKLFYQLKKTGFAVINNDDAFKNCYLLDQNRNITYGFQSGDYQVLDFKMDYTGTVFSYVHNGKKIEVKTNLVGKYNINNLLSIMIVLLEMGFSEKQICSAVLNLESPNGRMEMIHYRDNLIIIDYAHTPDAMEKIIGTVREIIGGDIYVVFGCTGSRDRLKRPIMSRMATDLCKFAIFTSDDLHDEEFSQIIEDMNKDLQNSNYEVCMDRKEAIHKGMDLLKKNDILLILGKGHEEYMIIKDQKIPFQDRIIVEDYKQKL